MVPSGGHMSDDLKVVRSMIEQIHLHVIGEHPVERADTNHGKQLTAHHHALAERIYGFRRRRETILGPGLFADPSWDILLDLYISHHLNRRVSVTSACIASCAPASTALRWIVLLCDRGLLVRRPDPKDGRRVFLELAGDTHTKIETVLKMFEPTRIC